MQVIEDLKPLVHKVESIYIFDFQDHLHPLAGDRVATQLELDTFIQQYPGTACTRAYFVVQLSTPRSCFVRDPIHANTYTPHNTISNMAGISEAVYYVYCQM